MGCDRCDCFVYDEDPDAEGFCMCGDEEDVHNTEDEEDLND